MKSLSNQNGSTIVSAVVGMGLTIAAGVAWMQFMQTASKDEARIKVKQDILIATNRMIENLKSPDVGAANFYEAFNGLDLRAGSTINGNSDFGDMNTRRNYRLGLTEHFFGTPILRAGNAYENGRLYLSSMKYRLLNLSTTAGSDAQVWDRKGEIEIVAKFQYCSNGGQVFRVVAGIPVGDPLCTPPVEIERTIIKKVGFKHDSSGRVTSSPYFLRSPAGERVRVGDRPNVVISDTEEGLLDMANDYADLRSCVEHARTLMLTGKSGTTECGIVVQTGTFNNVFPVNSTTRWTSPPDMIPGSAYAEIISGGGGGGGKDKNGFDDGGLGGKAGKFFKIDIPGSDFLCDVTVGSGGRGGDTEESGKQGGDSILNCVTSTSAPLVNLVAPGGEGGRPQHTKNCGTPGEDLPTPTEFFRGGLGHPWSNSGCSAYAQKHGQTGAGGAGGNDASGDARKGGNGGDGRVKLFYKKSTITDPENVLSYLGMTIQDFYASSTLPADGGCVSQNGRSKWSSIPSASDWGCVKWGSSGSVTQFAKVRRCIRNDCNEDCVDDAFGGSIPSRVLNIPPDTYPGSDSMPNKHPAWCTEGSEEVL